MRSIARRACLCLVFLCLLLSPGAELRAQAAAEETIVFAGGMLLDSSMPMRTSISSATVITTASTHSSEAPRGSLEMTEISMGQLVRAGVTTAVDLGAPLSYFRTAPRQIRNSAIAARQFIDANAVMGVGTDAASPANFHTQAMWREMEALIESGMTPLQVISAATKTKRRNSGAGFRDRDRGAWQVRRSHRLRWESPRRHSGVRSSEMGGRAGASG